MPGTAAETPVGEDRRADLVRRLEAVRRELAAWAGWMADQSQPAAARRGVSRPACSAEGLNALHAQLLDEIERVDQPDRWGTRAAPEPAPRTPPHQLTSGRAWPRRPARPGW